MECEQARILIVDDNLELCQMIENILAQDGFLRVSYCLSCEEARKRLGESLWDFIILDVNFPGEDGFHFFKELKEKSDIPVLFLSARDQNEDRLTGLGLGADDYMTKPFLPKELLLRLRAILRRTYRGCEKTEEKLMVGEREVDLEAGVVRLAGDLPEKEREIPLTNKEYHLLKLFLENRGKILTLDFLAEAVWGANYYGYENTLMVHIRKLREKIEENPSTPQWLITVKGLGYRLNR